MNISVPQVQLINPENQIVEASSGPWWLSAAPAFFPIALLPVLTAASMHFLIYPSPHLLLAVLGLRCRSGLSLVAASGAALHGGRAPGGGCFCCGARAPGRRLGSCPAAETFLDQGSNPVSLHRQADFSHGATCDVPSPSFLFLTPSCF